MLAGGKIAGIRWQQDIQRANDAVQVLLDFPETQKGPKFLEYLIFLKFIREKQD